MAKYPREDPRTALPQIEKLVAELEEKIKELEKRIEDLENA